MGDVNVKVPKEIIKEDFMYFITNAEWALLKKAENSFSLLKDFEKTLLIEFFNTYDYLDLPKEGELNEQIISIAESCIITKSMDYIKAMKEGIPLSHDEFWSKMNVQNITSILIKQAPTPDKIIGCLETEEDLTSGQCSAFYYLKVSIRSLDKDQLKRFLCYVTGSCNMPHSIKVTFTSLTGACRRAIVHTCSNVIKLPSTYADYQDFKNELQCILDSEFAFHYSQLWSWNNFKLL